MHKTMINHASKCTKTYKSRVPFTDGVLALTYGQMNQTISKLETFFGVWKRTEQALVARVSPRHSLLSK